MFISLIFSHAASKCKPPGCEPVCQKEEYMQLRGEESSGDCIKCLCVREENNTTLPLVWTKEIVLRCLDRSDDCLFPVLTSNPKTHTHTPINTHVHLIVKTPSDQQRAYVLVFYQDYSADTSSPNMATRYCTFMYTRQLILSEMSLFF